MKILFADGTDATRNLTPAQVASIERVTMRFTLNEPVTVHPMLCGDGCVMLGVGTMVLGIETDGYTHS